MPGLVPGIHVLLFPGVKDVDGRDEPGHDDLLKIHFRNPPRVKPPQRLQLRRGGCR
jgi:hypothetical protein